MLHDFIAYLRNRLTGGLPGWDAQVKMAPNLARAKEPPPVSRSLIRESAVMLLLSPAIGRRDIEILLTLRNRQLSHHGGQISLPGGRLEDGESIWEAARRESHEEVGLDIPTQNIIGKLSPLYVPVSNNMIHPVIAHSERQHDLKLQEEEVEEAFYLPLTHLLDGRNVKQRAEVRQGISLKYPYWEVHPEVPLWGATAMILSEMSSLFGEFVEGRAD